MARKHIKLLAGVTGTGAGSSFDITSLDTFSLFYESNTVTSGATVVIQVDDMDGNWHILDSQTVSADGLIFVQKTGAFINIRANVTAYTDGTHTVSIVGIS